MGCTAPYSFVMDPLHDTSQPRHPIRVVAERTGVSPNLLRAWERRYGIVDPERSDGGQRLYSDADVDRILLLRRVVDAGRAIGTVAELTIPELQKLAAEDEEARADRARAEGSGAVPLGSAAQADVVEEAFAAVRALDPDGLEQFLRREVVSMGGEAFLDRLVAPLLVEIGSSWREGRLRPAHEHIAVAVIKQVLGWMMERARVTRASRVLVTGTLTGEKHEVGALLAGTAAALEGWRVIFLGQDLPPDEIAHTARSVGAHAVGVSVVNPEDWDAVTGQLRELLGLLPEGVPLVLGGAAAPDMVRSVADVRLRAMSSLDQFRATLRSLS